jgi:hypothetical protein
MVRTLKYISFLSVIMILNCATPHVWQGQFMRVSYTRFEPKEDFKVQNYVVVAFDMYKGNKFAHEFFRFDLYQSGKRVGNLTVCDRSTEDPMFGAANLGYNFYLIGGNLEGGNDRPIHAIHRRYKDLPDYEKVKNDVKDVLINL